MTDNGGKRVHVNTFLASVFNASDESISGSVDEDAAAGGPVVEGLRAPQEPVAVVEQKPIPKKQNIENILAGWNGS